ncbi:MAG: RagB/SusD family nutrient uptake outer membrane protein [Alistipes sp.]|jgi:hypothetical protein|nr:RagB/SusD family nutrient uptake outer membrane protein [Alistipes sp.]
MKNFRKYGLTLVSAGLLALVSGCNDWLEVPPLNKIPAENLTQDEGGINGLLANLYQQMPMEDFNYHPDDNGFNRRSWSGNQTMQMPGMLTDEATQSQGMGIGAGNFNYWGNRMGDDNNGSNGREPNPYRANRDISIFLNTIATARDNGVIDEAKFNRLSSEAHFIRAYIYYQLAKRYGGVSIISEYQDDSYFAEGSESLKVPRSTEYDTWDFVLTECDKAFEYLPTQAEMGSDGDARYRATKWAALALKSRAALYAASIAKYSSRVSFAGEAADKKLVGMEASQAAYFYGKCIEASDKLIKEGGYSLYRPAPANAAEAAKNFQDLFITTPAEEVILGRNYISGLSTNYQGHHFDNFYSPSQVPTGFHKGNRFAVTLDMVDLYEDYTDNGSGASAPIVTRTDGNESFHFSTNTPSDAQIAAIPFVKYDDPYDAFRNKDARLLASVVVPGATFKGVTIVMQGGLIDQNGKLMIYQDANATGKDGVSYNTYGGSATSGFKYLTSGDEANYTSTGFSIRKYLQEFNQPSGAERSSTTPWIDFRLAEIYLNYAEAVAESNTGDATAAAGYLNALRKRAGHTDNIELTVANVLKERRVELAFENFRLSDQFRRREYHSQMQGFRRHALVQLIDLREDTPKYVFLRMEQYHDIVAGGRTFQTNDYYFSIPDTGVSGLINNPGK